MHRSWLHPRLNISLDFEINKTKQNKIDLNFLQVRFLNWQLGGSDLISDEVIPPTPILATPQTAYTKRFQLPKSTLESYARNKNETAFCSKKCQNIHVIIFTITYPRAIALRKLDIPIKGKEYASGPGIGIVYVYLDWENL